MWNSLRTDDRQEITSEVIAFSGGNGDEIHAYVARPGGSDPVPGVVAVHHMPGWDEFYREFCDRLARHGYAVICPDLSRRSTSPLGCRRHCSASSATTTATQRPIR